MRDGAFELLSKSRARAEYALPDSAFIGLPSLSKPNPRHEAFAPLQLYLRKQLVQEAYRLYEDEDGLQREKQKRKKRAFHSAATRTNHLLKKQHVLNQNQGATQEPQATDKPKKAQIVLAADTDHRHVFGAETFDKESNNWTKTCICGLLVNFEKW